MPGWPVCRRGAAAVAFATALALLVGCSGHRRAGTGDLAFRLLWEGMSDLDLFVVDPAGECIAFGSRLSASGGALDVDCNAGTGWMCTHPIENVYWPPGKAPAGEYAFWVHAHSLIPAEAPLAFELRLYLGTRVAWRHDGVLREHDEVQGAFLYRYSARGAAPVPSGEPPEDLCEGFWRPGTALPPPVPPGSGRSPRR